MIILKRFVKKLAFILIIVCCVCLTESNLSFNYENRHKYGGRRMNIPSFFGFLSRYAYPEPLPTTKRVPLIQTPYESISQGARKINDTRVFRRRFDYEPQEKGHHVFCEGLFDCVISYISLETTGGVPILLRGGVGYKYFVAVAKAKPYDRLVGRIRVYCVIKNKEYYKEIGLTPN